MKFFVVRAVHPLVLSCKFFKCIFSIVPDPRESAVEPVNFQGRNNNTDCVFFFCFQFYSLLIYELMKCFIKTSYFELVFL